MNTESKTRHTRSTSHPEGWMTPQNTAVLMVDHQTGISNGIADCKSQPEFQNNVAALAKVALMHKLPVLITTSAADGPNGPLIKTVSDILEDAPVVHRPGQINAWDHEGFVEAVRATGRNKLVIAGVSTEVCVALCAIAAVRDGFDVYAVMDASGTWNGQIETCAMQRMAMAGIVPMTWVGIAAELRNDWRNPTGEKLAEIMAHHLSFYGNVMGSHFAAKNG